jgi:hypothetical protein
MRFPVSFAQQRLWFLDQLEPGVPTYNMPYAMCLDGPLDSRSLQRALDAMVARHAVLRTSIVAFDGVPEQVVADTGTVPIERIDLPAAMEDGERARQAESIAADRARQPFDLAAGPLMRATLIGAGPDRHLLVLVMHHIISDGVSMEILIGELSAAYRAETAGVPASLPPLWMTYGDYAVWQRDRMRGEELDRQLSYWREQLRGAPQVLTLPGDRPRPAEQSTRGAVAEITVDAETTRRLATVAHDANATMFMVFFTGFVAVLSRYARETDIVIGTQLAGRTHTELDPIVGMFTNTVPLRMSVADDPTFAVLLRRVRDTTLDAMTHQQVPFEKLVEEFAPDRTLGHWPLIQVQFVSESVTPPALDLPGITSRCRELPTGTAKLDMSVFADPREGQATQLAMQYCTDQFDPPWADRFLRCMAHLVGHAANAPGTPVADLPMLSATERDALIIGRNRQALPGGSGESSPRASTAPDDESVDVRAALPAPRWGASPSATGRVEPRNAVEATLVGIWSDLLGTEEPVGVHDNLFAAGGHSLTATRFVARVADTYGVSLPVHHVFAGPTVAELAMVISADPEFGLAADSSRHAELDALSDEDLDELLRAALAQRNQRRANAGGSDS